jgi:hypothetical protein
LNQVNIYLPLQLTPTINCNQHLEYALLDLSRRLPGACTCCSHERYVSASRLDSTKTLTTSTGAGALSRAVSEPGQASIKRSDVPLPEPDGHQSYAAYEKRKGVPVPEPDAHQSYI